MDKMETSDSSSSESDENENELEGRAEELERQLADNKYLYDVHVELVNLYRQIGDLKSMRAAYERFYELFPLTPELWLTWLKIEMELAISPEDKKNVLGLFEKAVEDYFNQFVVGICSIFHGGIGI
ncbi:squamous cell carcinoma antigen recognized by T-cells 3 [Agrilus planipennis]|uniref:Squamous cell carcinoma antigen recognized by T-cells 3 n=1 Tax=Agrilus planipennis TaxID=224129 RepID=A0A1W4WV50_AGRPL|nr:squamous cell carcinoma antigen recognized by T-cells 3 isoform X3 [Agrilus planipennis]XP_025829163.1 squamous cell carcinoma antigen recognized by T-cells 3 [Agrilus planipennis]